jgi:hypothetical protein
MYPVLVYNLSVIFTIAPFDLLQRVSVPVQVSNSDDLSSYEVVEPVDRAGVDEAVSNPEPCLHYLLDFSLHLQEKGDQSRLRMASYGCEGIIR